MGLGSGGRPWGKGQKVRCYSGPRGASGLFRGGQRGYAPRRGKGACAHEDEDGGDDREEDAEAEHDAAARGAGEGESRVGSRVVRPRGYAALGGMRERGMVGGKAAGGVGVGGWGQERAQAGAKRHEAA